MLTTSFMENLCMFLLKLLIIAMPTAGFVGLEEAMMPKSELLIL